MSPERRILIALRVLDKVRAAIAVAGGQYSGGFTPNLQSVQDVLTLPAALVEKSLIGHPEFNAHGGEEPLLRDLWNGATPPR